MPEIAWDAISVFFEALQSSEGFIAVLLFFVFLLRPEWGVRLKWDRGSRRWAFVVVLVFFIYAFGDKVVQLEDKVVQLEKDLKTKTTELNSRKPNLTTYPGPIYYFKPFPSLIILMQIKFLSIRIKIKKDC